MNFTKIILTSELAHFKNSINGKNQNTFKSPPVSTIVGILKNIYGEDIQNFIFGYTCEYNGIFTDVANIYKTVSSNKKCITDICFIEYLIKPTIRIYTDIESEIILDETLNLGKTNCLAKCRFAEVEINNEKSIGYNQWTPKNIGHGIIQRINLETKYNKLKGYYDYITALLRHNTQFESQYKINDIQEGIQLWKYENEENIKCYQEKL